MNVSIYPAKKRPYYFVVPRYVRTSAGIRAIHLLTHWLNRFGEEAYVCIYPAFDGELTRPDLITPVLTRDIIDRHESEERTAIVVYTDTTEENILNATNIIRFFGHLPGHLTDLKRFSSHEFDYSFSSFIAKKTRFPGNHIFIPTIDTNIFRPSAEPVSRSGSCYYAAKFKNIHHGEVFGVPDNCFEIVRDSPDQLSQEALAELFRRTELLYCFEDSAIANEAALCGCPVVLMPNKHFDRPIAIDEVGWDGYAWGESDAEISRAKATVGDVYNNYMINVSLFPERLTQFIDRTQNYFERLNVPQSLRFYQNCPKLEHPQNQAARENSAHPKHSYKRMLLYSIPVLGPRYRNLFQQIETIQDQLAKATEHNVALAAKADAAESYSRINAELMSKNSELRMEKDTLLRENESLRIKLARMRSASEA